jgi:hypothetical protein
MGVFVEHGTRVPTSINIIPKAFQTDRGGDLKKTSDVETSPAFGPGGVIGLLINKRRQDVQELAFTMPSGRKMSASEVTKVREWRGTLEALQRFMPPTRKQRWVLFELPSISDPGFTSQIVVSNPPKPPNLQDVPLMVLHSEKGESASRVRARIRLGEYGHGVSVLRAPDEVWKKYEARQARGKK